MNYHLYKWNEQRYLLKRLNSFFVNIYSLRKTKLFCSICLYRNDSREAAKNLRKNKNDILKKISSFFIYSKLRIELKENPITIKTFLQRCHDPRFDFEKLIFPRKHGKKLDAKQFRKFLLYSFETNIRHDETNNRQNFSSKGSHDSKIYFETQNFSHQTRSNREKLERTKFLLRGTKKKKKKFLSPIPSNRYDIGSRNIQRTKAAE